MSLEVMFLPKNSELGVKLPVLEEPQMDSVADNFLLWSKFCTDKVLPLAVEDGAAKADLIGFGTFWVLAWLTSILKLLFFGNEFDLATVAFKGVLCIKIGTSLLLLLLVAVVELSQIEVKWNGEALRKEDWDCWLSE